MNKRILTKGISLIEILVIIVIVGLGLSLMGISLSTNIFFQEEYTGRVNDCKSLEASIMAEGNRMFSFSVEIETDDEIINFSSEDRQFATIQKGDIIKVKVFKYPPWNIKKAGTYHNGRLLKKYKK